MSDKKENDNLGKKRKVASRKKAVQKNKGYVPHSPSPRKKTTPSPTKK